MDAEKYPYTLIVRSLKGELDSAEAAELEDWLQDPSHREWYNQVVNLWGEIPETYFLSSLDKKEDWLKIRRNILPDTKVRNWYWAAAAAILLMVGFLGWNRLGTNTEMVFSSGDTPLEFRLSDSSLIVLNRNSTLTLFRGFNEEVRKVKLTGEAYFQVARDENKPFIVLSGPVNTTVLGTQFNIRERQTHIAIHVLSGKVAFADADEEVILEPNQGAEFTSDQQVLLLKTFSPNFLSWKTGRLVFENAPILEALEDISRHFQIEINTTRLASSDLQITTVFENADVESVWAELRVLLNVEITQINNVYHFVTKP